MSLHPSSTFALERRDWIAGLEKGLGLLEADFEWVTQQLMNVANTHCKGRIISTLEGGYVLSPLARSVAAHIKVLIGAD